MREEEAESVNEGKLQFIFAKRHKISPLTLGM
jgi:hypothetical protein